MHNNFPLFLIGGASGSGKTAVCNKIAEEYNEFVALDGDCIWQSGAFDFMNPVPFYEVWLNIAQELSKCGRPVAIFNAGVGMPENIEICKARKDIGEIHYLHLFCSDDEINTRLRKRPEWNDENPMTENFIQKMQGMNQSIKQYKNPNVSITKLDTSDVSLDETTKQVVEWMKSKL